MFHITRFLLWSCPTQTSMLQGIVQSAFLYGYMATQLLGGTLADRLGGERELCLKHAYCHAITSDAGKHVTCTAGKVVMACGIAWFSLASLLLPVALSSPVRTQS